MLKMNLINLDRTYGELTNLTLKTIRLRGSQSLQTSDSELTNLRTPKSTC